MQLVRNNYNLIKSGDLKNYGCLVPATLATAERSYNEKHHRPVSVEQFACPPRQSRLRSEI